MLTPAGMQSLRAVLEPLDFGQRGAEPALELKAGWDPTGARPVAIWLKAGNIEAARQITREELEAIREWATVALGEIDRRTQAVA